MLDKPFRFNELGEITHLFKGFFSREVQSEPESTSDNIYYVNLEKRAKLLKTKELRKKEGRESVSGGHVRRRGDIADSPPEGSVRVRRRPPLVPSQ